MLTKVLLIVLPVLISLYLHFGDSFISNTVSWRKIVGNDKVLPIKLENKGNEFNLWSPKTGVKYIFDIDTVTTTNLNDFLLDWGIDPAGMKENDTQIRIDLLLTVSASDFWRQNYFLHPKKSRIRNWLWVHELYLSQVAALKEFEDKDKLQTNFIKISRKFNKESYELEFFTDHEDMMMFQFFRDHLKFLNIDILQEEHKPLLEKVKIISEQLEGDNIDLNDIKKSITEWEQLIVKHFIKEEQVIVPVMLNLNNSLYRTYRSYLSWFYYFMY